MKIDEADLLYLLNRLREARQLRDTAISKRELFAAMALQGILSCPDLRNLGNREACLLAISYADQLVERLGTGDGFTEVRDS